jgi:hypothetical protein
MKKGLWTEEGEEELIPLVENMERANGQQLPKKWPNY